MTSKQVWGFGSLIATAVVSLILIIMLVSWNSAGKRQVVQYANGTLECVFDAGPYPIWFGGSTEYNDIITYDFDQSDSGDSATLDENGIQVRYSKGGLGTVFGLARYSLPNDCVTMLKLHKEFRSNTGLAYKLIKPYTDEAANQTAGLMTSSESYELKRSTYTSWMNTQLKNGLYKQRLDEIVTTEPGKEYCLDTELLTDKQKKFCQTVKKTRSQIAVIDDAQVEPHKPSDLKQYGVGVTGFSLQSPDYEPKTLTQISQKRDATMGAITAAANAERAKAETLEAKEKGLKNVEVAKYAQEELKVKKVVAAEQAAEVAVIKARQLVDVATANKDQAAQKALAALEYKKEQILIGEGDAKRKKLVLQADGALEQKLATYERVNANYATAISKHKWVPDVQMGASEGGSSNAAADIISMLSVKTAKELSLDMKIK